jgi:hypothetical protein
VEYAEKVNEREHGGSAFAGGMRKRRGGGRWG